MVRGSSIIGVLLLVWIAWIFMASGNEQRIERSCQPTLWAGNIVTSVTALVSSAKNQNKIEGAFEKLDYGCRYIVWRLFFEDTWLEEKDNDNDNGNRRNGIR